jgi:ATP adenylyltransferase
MDILHSYWRMEYVTSPSDGERGHKNPFAELPKQGDDRAALIVYRGETGYLVLNRYPYNPGHLLAVPYREVPRLQDLDATERAELMELIIRAQDMLEAAMRPDGFNIGFNIGRTGGAGIPTHLHAHIVPRWNGDNNFLPVIGKTRSLPQALDATWEVLRSIQS